MTLAAPPAFAFAPHGDALPDFDTRDDVKPASSLIRAQSRLDERLGAQGSVSGSELSGAVSFVRRTDRFLTGPSDASAADVALAYLGAHRRAFGFGAGDIDGLDLTRRYTSWDGVTHLTFAQLVEGVPSYDSAVYANVTKEGELINLSGSPVGDLLLADADPSLGRKGALAAARDDVDGADARRFADSESAELVAFANGDGSARLAYSVDAESDDGLLYNVVVDADTGRALARFSRTSFLNQASIWENHPDQTVAPTTVNLGSDPSWIDDTAGGTRLKGNNTHTYADVNDNNIADPGEDVAQAGSDWQFTMTFFNQPECPAFGCTWDSANAATKATNQSQAITGMFYLVNRYHDHLLAPPIGFDEASGNFERVNSSGMGLGNDEVLAEGNDGSATNNANFSVPADGSRPRMQMMFWSQSWDVSASDAADVVYHEYTHGLSKRLVGNAAGLTSFQSFAMGEGWSDWYANDFLVATGEKADGPGEDLMLGEYVIDLFGVGGIRRQRMDCKPASEATFCPAYGTAGAGGFTFGDLGKVATSHDSGEIWSQTLWDLREALGSNDARAVITGGLRLSPLQPTFLEARDAILQSALTLGVPRAPIWDVFAARGMGLSASTPGATSMSATEAFDVPGVHHVGTEVADPVPLGDGDGIAEPGETLRVTATLQNLSLDTVANVEGAIETTTPDVLIGRPSSTWPDFAPDPSPAQANDPPFTVTVPESVSCGSTVDLAITASSSAGSITVPPLSLHIGDPLFTTASPNLAIPDNAPAGVNTTIDLPAGDPIPDIDVSIDQLTHTFNGDLRLELTSPEATSVVLVNRRGGSSDGLTDLVFDDEAAAPITGIPTTPGPVSGSFTPEEPLSAFDGENPAGTWTLNVSDNAGADTGTLNAWGLSSEVECATSVTLPIASTSPAGSVAGTTATLSGDIDANGAATEYAFDWGTTSAYGERTPARDGGDAVGPVARSANLTGLTPETIYHFRALALRDGEVVAQGADRTFTTPADTTPPQTTITKKPKKQTTNRRATFRFKASESGSTFRCKLDKKPYRRCSSPLRKRVKHGRHKFRVRATDAVGNADPTPAKWVWNVKRKR